MTVLQERGNKMWKCETSWFVALSLMLAGHACGSRAAESASAALAQATVEKAEKAEELTKPTEQKEKSLKVRLAHIEISGQLPESPGQMTLFGDLGVDLRKTISRFDKAAQDPNVAGVVLQIGPTSLSRGKLSELREAIRRVRSSGKKVYAQMESAMGAQFLLATACDEIIMPEAGILLIPGIHAEMAYYKELLGKVGIEADMMHVGAYKGAAEALTRTSMSEPVRKNLTAMVDDLFDQMVSTIATDRQMKIDEVRALVDQGLLTVTKAHQAGLIDRVAYPDEFRAQLKNEHEAEELVYVVNYAKKKLDTDFSGPMGMIKLFQTIMGVSSRDYGKGPKIAIVYAVGPIMSGESQSDPFGGQTMGSETIVEALQKAADNDKVKAIVLRINSPGGSALASDLIWRATQSIDKPVVASMGDVAASGGYYIAMGADRILAEPGTITGSIGVVGGKLSLGGLYGKIGITTDSIARGKNSGIFSATSKFSESERDVVSDMMHDVYRLFTTKAAQGRSIPLDKLETLAGGQVYTGRDAKRNGLVDEIGTLNDAVRVAKQLAGLDADAKVGLEILPEPKNPLEELFDTDSDAQREARLFGGVSQFMPELIGPMRRAYQLRQVMREPVALIMPFWLAIR